MKIEYEVMWLEAYHILEFPVEVRIFPAESLSSNTNKSSVIGIQDWLRVKFYQLLLSSLIFESGVQINVLFGVPWYWIFYLTFYGILYNVVACLLFCEGQWEVSDVDPFATISPHLKQDLIMFFLIFPCPTMCFSSENCS